MQTRNPISTPLLLALPPEILCHILTYLCLQDVLSISHAHPLIRQIVSILDPCTSIVLRTLIAGVPYPSSLRTLGVYSFVPRPVWKEILVRAQVGWILDELIIPPGLKEKDWREIFLRRFLPSWARDKAAGQSWRSLYMRTLRRIHHRSQRPCNKDEPFTSWITLDRKGTVTTNKLYSDTFDPQTIIRELATQNDLSGYPATIRPLVRLIDISVFVLGTLGKPSSYQPSANAHALLHPPLCYPDTLSGRDQSWQDLQSSSPSPLLWNIRSSVRTEERVGRGRSYSEGGPSLMSDPRSEFSLNESNGRSLRQITESRMELSVEEVPTGPSSSSNFASLADRSEDDSRRGRRRSIPLSRTLSGGRSTSTVAISPNIFGSSLTRPSLASSFGSMFGLRQSFSHASGERIGNVNSVVSLPTSSSTPVSLPLSSIDPPVSVPVPVQLSSSTVASRCSSDISSRSSLIPTVPKNNASARRDSFSVQLPYSVMKYPQPRESHRFYPNHTPGGEDTRREPPRKPPIMENLNLNGGNKMEDEDDLIKEEWPEVEGTARWVGPMIVIAALPSRLSSTHSDGASTLNSVDLLPNPGSYVSFDAEDLWAIAPWLRDDGFISRGLIGRGIGYL